MANHGNTLCGKQERLEIRGNSSTCMLVIRDPVLLDNGKWTCAISDEKMDTVKDHRMLDMVVEGKMNLTALNNTKEVIEGDKVEVVCRVSGTYPPPHLAWSTPHPGILHTLPSEVLPTMSGVVTVQQRAYYRTRVGERGVNISCMARQGNITRRVRSMVINIKQMEMMKDEEENNDNLVLISGILLGVILFLVTLILIILLSRKILKKKYSSNSDLVEKIKQVTQEEKHSDETVNYETIDNTYVELFNNGLPQYRHLSDTSASGSFSSITSSDAHEEPVKLETKTVDHKREEEEGEELNFKDEYHKPTDYLETHFDSE